MISFKDHEDENGNIDWNSYREAQKKVGEICSSCGESILFYNDLPSQTF